MLMKSEKKMVKDLLEMIIKNNVKYEKEVKKLLEAFDIK